MTNLPLSLASLQAGDPDPLESMTLRLHEAISILDAIADGNMLAALPEGPEARRRHQQAVSLMSVLRRELRGVVDDLEFAQTVSLLTSRP